MSTDISQQKKIIAIIEKHPGSWIFFGLILFLIASGAVSYQVAGQEIKFQAEKNETGSLILQIIGLSSLLIGFYVILKTKNQTNRFIDFIITLIWISSILITLYPLFIQKKVMDDLIKFWRYDLKYPHGNLIVTPNSKALADFYKNNLGLIFVIYSNKIRTEGNIKHNTNVTISQVYDIPEPSSDSKGEISIENIKQPSDINNGDDIYFDVGVIPKDVNINNFNCVEDIINKGGKILEWKQCPAIFDFNNTNIIIQWLKTLPIEKKEQIKSSL
jgi:hypothetical protein